MDSQLKERIEKLIAQQDVVLFMKGTKNFPQCGFSATVVEVLKRTGTSFADVNVLADPEVRQGIKEFSDWPTIPQLYVRGTFVGGCDIIREMYQNGELQTMLGTETDNA